MSSHIPPPPPCKQLCTRSCSNKHTHSPSHHPGVLGLIPKREEIGKTGAPCLKVPGFSRVPRHHKRIHQHARRVFVSSFSTGPPEDRDALHCQWNAIATQPIGLVSFQARGILPVDEEQSLTVAAAKAAALRINLNVEGCDGQTSPHRPLLVVSRSTCPPLPPSPHANKLCSRSCSKKKTHTVTKST